MTETRSTMLKLGTKAPNFILSDLSGNVIERDQFAGSAALLIIFMCNHCPYVKHVREELVKLVKEYQKKGVGVVGISANDITAYPEDGPEKMAEEARRYGYTFPYLFDESQEVAKAFRASCTPDFFLFDKELKLFYRGQMDDSRPSNRIAVTGKDLRGALDAVLEGRSVPEKQKASMGCNIKWKPGSEPEYFSRA